MKRTGTCRISMKRLSSPHQVPLLEPEGHIKTEAAAWKSLAWAIFPLNLSESAEGHPSKGVMMRTGTCGISMKRLKSPHQVPLMEPEGRTKTEAAASKSLTWSIFPLRLSESAGGHPVQEDIVRAGASNRTRDM